MVPGALISDETIRQPAVVVMVAVEQSVHRDGVGDGDIMVILW